MKSFLTFYFSCSLNLEINGVLRGWKPLVVVDLLFVLGTVREWSAVFQEILLQR